MRPDIRRLVVDHQYRANGTSKRGRVSVPCMDVVVVHRPRRRFLDDAQAAHPIAPGGSSRGQGFRVHG